MWDKFPFLPSPHSPSYQMQFTFSPENVGNEKWMMLFFLTSFHSTLNRSRCVSHRPATCFLEWARSVCECNYVDTFRPYLLSRAPASPHTQTLSSRTWLGSIVPAGACKTVGCSVMFTSCLGYLNTSNWFTTMRRLWAAFNANSNSPSNYHSLSLSLVCTIYHDTDYTEWLHLFSLISICVDFAFLTQS